jgi:thiamine-phosphate pyrophosphorylase
LKNILSPLSGLYAISDEILTPIDSILEKALKVLQGGARLFQLRDKSASDEEALSIVRKLRELCDRYGAKLIIDDRVELAKEANGVHIGALDRPISEARSILGSEAIIGVSCYGDLNRAIEAEKLGASYVSFGACFNSATKPNAKVIDHGVFGEAKSRLKIPICAIGGITTQNAPALLGRGADMIAIVSDLWKDGDPKQKAKDFASLWL